MNVKESIATIMQSQNKYIIFQFPEVQQQTDGSSCGLFSLAFAYEICDGKDQSFLKGVFSR